jgi:hypothetical protein
MRDRILVIVGIIAVVCAIGLYLSLLEGPPAGIHPCPVFEHKDGTQTPLGWEEVDGKIPNNCAIIVQVRE